MPRGSGMGRERCCLLLLLLLLLRGGRRGATAGAAPKAAARQGGQRQRSFRRRRCHSHCHLLLLRPRLTSPRPSGNRTRRSSRRRRRRGLWRGAFLPLFFLHERKGRKQGEAAAVYFFPLSFKFLSLLALDLFPLSHSATVSLSLSSKMEIERAKLARLVDWWGSGGGRGGCGEGREREREGLSKGKGRRGFSSSTTEERR